MRWLQRLARVFRRRQDDEAVDEELRLHIELETEDLVRRGLPPEEARRRALIAFGGVERIREEAREARVFVWLDRWGPRALAADLRRALRSLGRTPWYAVTVAAVIALGVVFVVSVFAVVDGPLFKPLPYPNAERVFAINGRWSRLPDPGVSLTPMSIPEHSAWRASLPGAHVAAYYSSGDTVVIAPEERVRGIRVSPDFFDAVRMPPTIGGFAADDFEEYTPIRPAILAHGLWLRRFGGDRSVLGKTFKGSGDAGIRVVGVLPADFLIPDPGAEVITPLPTLPQELGETPLGRFLRMIVRLPPSMEVQEAAARLDLAAVDLVRAWPLPPPAPGLTEAARIRRTPFDVVTLQPIREALTADVRRMSQVAFWAALVLALLACLNVTGLTVARVRDRWRDLAVRRSLGAGQSDLVRLMAVESGVLTLVGAAVGVVAAPALIAGIADLMPGSMILFKAPEVDGRVLGFTALVAVCWMALITAGAARAASHSSLRPSLTSGGVATVRTGMSLVAVQVALAFVIVVSGSLVAGSLLRVWSEDVGLPLDDTALIRMGMPIGSAAAETEQLIAELRRQPSVIHAGGIDRSLLQRAWNGSVFRVDRPPEGTTPESIAVTTGYFEAAGLQATEGRLMSNAEIATAAPVVVVSELVADAYWPGQDPVGQLLTTSDRTFTVVGVVPNIRFLALDMELRGEIYWSMTAKRSGALRNVLVEIDSNGSLNQLVAWIQTRCPGCRIHQSQTLTDAMGASIQLRRRLSTWIFTSFGVAALVIVGVGVLGLVAMAAARRTRELGIRVALGATPLRVIRQMIGEQASSMALGLIAGGIIAAWAVRSVDAHLYKTSIYDPWSWASAVGALVLIALVAALLPSLRASRVDPVVALRAE
jgi:predicted permease